jgi:hypothetical protein
MKQAIIIVGVLCLAACSQEVPSPPAPAPVPAPATAQQVQAAASRLSPDKFAIALTDVDCTAAPVAIAHVTWAAGALAADGVSMSVESPGNARKLWLEGAANGKADSGKWVFPDSRFTLQNRTSGEVLAQHDVGKLACPAT